MSKIAHLHIGENKYDYDNKCFVPDEGRRNRMTLICTLDGGSIDYILYSGWTSSGTGFALSNMGTVEFPVYKAYPEQTKEEFVQELVDRINASNLYRVVRQVGKVTFEPTVPPKEDDLTEQCGVNTSNSFNTPPKS